MINKHIFSLIENPGDLPSSNENMADMYYREVIPTRNIQDIGTFGTYSSKFAGSAISLRWMLDNRTWWIPSRSYLSIEVQLTKPDLLPIRHQDQIAPNMGIAPSLFNRLHFKMNDISVAHISEYVAQCEAMAKRVYETSEWLDRNIGQDTGFWNPHFRKRQTDILKDGVTAEEVIVEEHQGFTRFTREELGLGVSEEKQNIYINVLIDPLVNLLGIFGVGGAFVPPIKEVFEPGDLLFFKPQNNSRYFVYMLGDYDSNFSIRVLGITGATSILGQDTSISGPGYKLYILRHKCKLCLLSNSNDFVKKNPGGTLQRALTAANSEIIYSAGGAVEVICICPGDFVFTKPANGIAADTLVNGGIIFNIFSDLAIRLGLSENEWEGGDEVAEADESVVVKTGYCRIPILEWTNVNVAFELEASTNLVTITFLNFTLQNIWDVLQPGDYVHLSFVTDVEETWGFVQDIVDATHFHYSISRAWSQNLGDGSQDNGFLVDIFRYLPKCTTLAVNKAKNANKFDINWKPSCLSIFNYPGAIPGGCKFEFEIQGNNQFYTGYAIETPPGIQKVPRNASSGTFDYQLLVTSVKFYICTVTGPSVGDDQYSYYLNLNEIRAHTRTLNTGTTTQTAIDVTPSSYALALAFQDKRAEISSRTDYSITKFHVGLKEELYLRRYSIRFGGLSLPQPDADIIFDEDNLEDFWNRIYIRNQLYLNQYYKTTGGESYNDWKERGLFLYHPFIRSAGNKEGRVYVITQFQPETALGPGLRQGTLDNMNLFLFEFYRSFAYIRMSKGNVFEVRTAIQ